MQENTSTTGGKPPDRPRIRLFSPDDEPSYDGGMRTPDAITVREVVDWFLSEYSSTSDDALTEIRRILRLFADAYGDRTVDKVGGADLRDFVKAQKRVAKANTVARWYRTVKMAFNQAADANKIARSPFKMVKLPKGDEGRDLTPSEFNALLRRATPVFRRVLIFCRYCGARPKELRTATWSMVNWGTECTTVIFRRGFKTFETQTESKARKLYLPIPLVKLLLWLKARSKSEFIFTNSFGGQWKTGALCKRLRSMRAAAGFGTDVKLYGCRHAFGTNAILNGNDLAEVKEMMGHASIKTTQRYIHLAGKDAHMFGAIEKAAGRRKPKPEK